MPRRLLDLNGPHWLLGAAPHAADPEHAAWSELSEVTDWVTATVPGNVRSDLAGAGRLADLHFGAQAESSRWVDDHCWWMVRDLPAAPGPDERVHLVLRGVDYISDLFLNGQHVGRHEGMFSPQVHEITHLLGRDNRLAVRILGARWLPQDRGGVWERFLNRVEARVGGLPGQFPHRRDTLKCQMSFGWDFAPAMRTAGIWDDAYAVIGGSVFILDVVARCRFDSSGMAVEVLADVDASQAANVRLRYSLTGETFEGRPEKAEVQVALPPGPSGHSMTIPVTEPRLWWPWDQGEPDLYRLEVEVRDGDRLLDAVAETVGLRQVEMEGYTIRVNGRRVYGRGANWVPADILPGRVTADDYRALLTMARRANMNLLRVWGGGLREKRAFYDICDRLGLLVWQEFPFSCAFLTRYPRSREYLQLVDAEARAIVRDLRNHPSLLLWCAGNEFKPQRNAPLVQALRRAVTELDPTRAFLPASPHEGDHHNWRVWHHFRPPSAYREDQAALCSELGLQAPSDAAALRRFIPPDQLWPPGRSWAYHGAGMAKLRRYARPFLRHGEDSLEDFVRASQQAQSHGLAIAIEHFRRRKALGCGGVLIWQLNEPWPAVSWSLVDWYRAPKPAYKTVGELFAPLLVSADYDLKRYLPGDPFAAALWIVNDTATTFFGCRLVADLWDGEGRLCGHTEQDVEVPADSAFPARGVVWTIPRGGSCRLDCRVLQGAQVLAHNQYDPLAHDDLQPTPAQRLRSWIADHILPP